MDRLVSPAHLFLVVRHKGRKRNSRDTRQWRAARVMAYVVASLVVGGRRRVRRAALIDGVGGSRADLCRR